MKYPYTNTGNCKDIIIYKISQKNDQHTKHENEKHQQEGKKYIRTSKRE